MSSVKLTLNGSEDNSASNGATRMGKVLGLGGCTNSGKTTIAKIISEMFVEEGATVYVVHQDDFFYPEEKVEKIYRECSSQTSYFYNYDSKSAIDHQGLIDAIRTSMLSYDYVILEGNMLTEWNDVVDLCDRIIFFTLDKDICYRRRSRRAYIPPDMPGYFDEVAWPAYRRHLQKALTTARSDPRLTLFDISTTVDQLDREQTISLIYSFLHNIVRFCREPLDAAKVVQLLSSTTYGVTSILKTTGDAVSDLSYGNYDELAHKKLNSLCSLMRFRYPSVEHIVILYRIGYVPVGEAIIILAVATPHHEDALHSAKLGVDELKRFAQNTGAGGGNCSWEGIFEWHEEENTSPKACELRSLIEANNANSSNGKVFRLRKVFEHMNKTSS